MRVESIIFKCAQTDSLLSYTNVLSELQLYYESVTFPRSMDCSFVMRFFIRVWRVLMCDIRNQNKTKSIHPPMRWGVEYFSSKHRRQWKGDEVGWRCGKLFFSFSFLVMLQLPDSSRTRLDRQERRECLKNKRKTPKLEEMKEKKRRKKTFCDDVFYHF